mmetsp:Transcript_9532/g.16511  ORF Transcript_9532/g.16511 Transcript_9532/m.16511 type:complete len:279 (-) Transcript_9532:50-886(-)
MIVGLFSHRVFQSTHFGNKGFGRIVVEFGLIRDLVLINKHADIIHESQDALDPVPTLLLVRFVKLFQSHKRAAAIHSACSRGSTLGSRSQLQSITNSTISHDPRKQCEEHGDEKHRRSEQPNFGIRILCLNERLIPQSQHARFQLIIHDHSSLDIQSGPFHSRALRNNTQRRGRNAGILKLGSLWEHKRYLDLLDGTLGQIGRREHGCRNLVFLVFTGLQKHRRRHVIRNPKRVLPSSIQWKAELDHQAAELESRLLQRRCGNVPIHISIINVRCQAG